MEATVTTRARTGCRRLPFKFRDEAKVREEFLLLHGLRVCGRRKQAAQVKRLRHREGSEARRERGRLPAGIAGGEETPARDTKRAAVEI